MQIAHHKEFLKPTFRVSALCQSELWQIYIISSINQTKLSFLPPPPPFSTNAAPYFLQKYAPSTCLPKS